MGKVRKGNISSSFYTSLLMIVSWTCEMQLFCFLNVCENAWSHFLINLTVSIYIPGVVLDNWVNGELDKILFVMGIIVLWGR